MPFDRKYVIIKSLRYHPANQKDTINVVIGFLLHSLSMAPI